MAATSNSYLRFPHIAGDLLTFVAEEDVWLAPATGGRATRLTSDRKAALLPRLSPDGRYVAWASARKGGNEAFAVSVDGGPVLQLTHWGSATTTVLGWLSAEEVVVVGPAGSRSRERGRPWAYAVRLDGSSRLLPYGPLRGLSTSADGAVLLGSVYSSEPAWWKRYRGGTGGKLWFDRAGSGEFEPILREVGSHLVDPMLVGDRIAFISDHEGVGALYSTDRDFADLRRHTDLGEFYARHAASDGSRVVYERAGELHLLESLDVGAEPVRLEISLPGVRAGREPFAVDTGEWLGEIALSQDGRAAAVEVRGTVHWLPVEHGPARTVLAEPGVRGRLPVVVPGGNAVLCVSDSGGEDGLDLVPTDGKPARRIGQGRLGRVYDLAVAPDGKTAAVSSEDGRLLLVDLGETAEEPISVLTRVELDEPCQLIFSPDSRYLAWAQVWAATGLDLRADMHVRLARLSDGAIVDVTGPRFHSHSPAFTHDGKYLALLSDQTYDPVYDGKLFDLGFPPGVRPYLVTLTDDTPSPFAPEIDGRPAATGTAEGQDAKTADPQVRVDLEGIAERIVPFPVEAGDYRWLRAVKNGVAWMAHREQGVLGETWRGSADQPPKPQLVRYDLAKRKRSVLVAALDAYAASPDGGRIAYRADGSLKVKAADDADEDATISVDLDRIQVRIDPVAEWTQMYDETWRLHRDNFWRPDMAGIDWVGMAARYRPLIGRLGGYDDLIDLLWELNGELGYSHAYAIPTTRSNPPSSAQGLLGADLGRDADGRWLIERVPPGESSVIEARSPLAAPGVRARAGEQIAAVDGRPVDPLRGPNPLLAGKAGRPVELTLRSANGDVGGQHGEVERRVAVVPLGSEALLRYHDRIAARRARVRESSGGRLGYLHVPDMQSLGWAEFHRGFTAELARDGLVLDLRENGGGHTSALVVEKLVRRVIGWVLARQGGVTPYPHDAPRGPIVTLIDEQAGSDGDIGPNAIRTYGLGPLVGVRTWGGVVGYDRDRLLVDRTMVSQPKLACWFEGPGFGIENHGVDPDVEVAIRPQDWAAGRDPQLETAIRLALESLRQHPAATHPALPTD
jgi:tricorn protease